MLIEKRIVVKVGTSSLTHGKGELNFRSFDRLARAMSDIANMGYEIVFVSSGAIAVGAYMMRMKKRPEKLSLKQAAASVGQCQLMHLYDKSFGEYGKLVGQILLTSEDVGQSDLRQNLINTFDSLLDMGIIPIVNENDSVSCAEIEAQMQHHTVFSDNDNLSAIVAKLCRAKTLVLLSDIDGLFTDDPHKNPEAELRKEIHKIDSSLLDTAGGAGSSRGTGGMITKLQAAKLATEQGIDVIISNGARPECLYDIVEGKPVGTLFHGKEVNII